MTDRVDGRGWTFLTNHAHVLICLAADPDMLLRTVAQRVGITERATQLIVADLATDGYITRTKVGRRNHYEVRPHRKLRHPLEAQHSVGVLLGLAGPPGTGDRAAVRPEG
jgi:hypothetical protein